MQNILNPAKVIGLLACLLGAAQGFSQTVLLDVTNTWKYEQTANLDGTNWTSPSFDDSAWPSGPGLLYYEDNTAIIPRNTLLTLGRMTYYFRAHFTLSEGINGAVLTFSNRIDDGAVFYLNGTEIQRVRMPAAPIPVTYSTLADVPPGGDALAFDVFTISGSQISLLATGDNVLAVEVHQSSSGSSDIVFGTALNVTYSSDPVVITAPPANISVLDGRSASFSVTVSGSGPITFQWLKDGVPISGATKAALYIPAAFPTSSRHLLRNRK